MSDSNPKYITVDEFNEGVKKWSVSTRQKIRSNIKALTDSKKKDWKGRKEQKLGKSVSARPRKSKGISYGVRFTFERHGVFLHYGVGRGYVKEGNSVVRASRLSRTYRYGGEDHNYTPEKLKQRANRTKKGSDDARESVNWFDSEIKSEIPVLADVAQEFYGDNAMKDILDNSNKSLIEKK